MKMNLLVLLMFLYGAEILSRATTVHAGSCYDWRQDCSNWKGYGYCKTRAREMKVACAKTCNLCGVKIKTTVPPRASLPIDECKNHRSDCSILTESGWCTRRKAYMEQACGPACGFCTKREENVVPLQISTTARTENIPKVPSSACFDTRKDCYRLAVVFKWCITKRIVMQKVCKKSCNYCQSKTATTTKRPTTTTTTTTSRTVVKVPTCKNLRRDCNQLGNEFGFCVSKRSAMEKLCPETCNYCPDKLNVAKKKEITMAPPKHVLKTTAAPVCMDRMRGCSFMLKKGWCSIKKNIMETKCRKTCGFCGVCEDTREDCFQYKTFGWCESKKDSMSGVCAKTCSLCRNACKDVRGGCDNLKKIGFCESRRSTMKNICAKTCNLCSGGTDIHNELTTTLQPATTPRRVKPGCRGRDAYGKARCDYYAHIGWCDKHGTISQNCQYTCKCVIHPTQNPNVHCKDSTHGCCWDNKTTKRDSNGSGCPACADDPRFIVLCARFGGDCGGKGGLAQSLQKYCSKTCKIC